MFNLNKKLNSDELESYRRCAIVRFDDEKYQEAIDNCDWVLSSSPMDGIALEIKIRSLFMLEKENGLKEISTLVDKLRRVEPNNNFLRKYDEMRGMFNLENSHDTKNDMPF